MERDEAIIRLRTALRATVAALNEAMEDHCESPTGTPAWWDEACNAYDDATAALEATDDSPCIVCGEYAPRHDEDCTVQP